MTSKPITDRDSLTSKECAFLLDAGRHSNSWMHRDPQRIATTTTTSTTVPGRTKCGYQQLQHHHHHHHHHHLHHAILNTSSNHRLIISPAASSLPDNTNNGDSSCRRQYHRAPFIRPSLCAEASPPPSPSSSSSSWSPSVLTFSFHPSMFTLLLALLCPLFALFITPTVQTVAYTGSHARRGAAAAAAHPAKVFTFWNTDDDTFPYRERHPEHPQYSNSYLTYSECDRIFISKSLNLTHGTVNGTFEGPTLPQYPPLPVTMPPPLEPPTNLSSASSSSNQSSSSSSPSSLASSTSTSTTTAAPTAATTVEPHARQCIYTFIGTEKERVRVTFTKFALRSGAPDCLDEYMDIYSEMPTSNTDLLSTPFGGRYCDEIIPHDRISLYHTIVLAFYTEKESTVGRKIFQGKYEFINATPYAVGTPVPNQLCSYAVYSDQQRDGELMSPTYPGVYPKDINCYYLFKGQKGQRVKLEFMDFDLYYGGPHCPMDYMKIYDGDSDQAPLIKYYCGQQRQLFVFSSGTSLYVHFYTKQRVTESQNRGFSAYFEFSEKYVNLGFIANNENSEHILGTECDQKILSKKESNGTIYAPNYPFLYHSNIQCKYYIYGLQDAQNLERINFHFDMLQIPTKDVNECTDAYVRLYTQTQVMEEFDYVYCGDQIPPAIVSDGPFLLVIFNSGTTQGQGFKATYWFETDFKIPGTQASPGQCRFRYFSSTGEKSGEFNSPRHPSNYPSNTYCEYEFFGEPDEQVMLVFSHFKYQDSEVVALGVPGYNEVCHHDWVEIYGIDPTGREIFYGRYCSSTAPGPIISEKGVNQMKVISTTDESDVSSGFMAQFLFIKAADHPKNCGENITKMENGIITSPQYPNNYPAQSQVCNWFIYAKPEHKIMVHFESFSVEGEPTSRGCSGAVVRVWVNPSLAKPAELCGENLANSSKEFISSSNVIRITFITAQKSVGATGFTAVWTEIQMSISEPIEQNLTSAPVTEPPPTEDYDKLNRTMKRRCPNNGEPTTMSQFASSSSSSQTEDQDEELMDSTIATVPLPLVNQSKANGGKTSAQKRTQPTQKHFLCEVTGYCISAKLRCNGIQNCGFGDSSDEDGCSKETKINIIELLGGLAGFTLFVCFLIGILILTIIVIVNWYGRVEAPVEDEIKEPPINGKGHRGLAAADGYGAHHYHVHRPVATIHPAASRNGSPHHVLTSHHGSPYRGVGYPSELTGTPTHRVIEVLTTVGSGSSAAKTSKWSTLPSTSSEGMPNQLMMDDDVPYHLHHHYINDPGDIRLDSPGNGSIPPPPPPPAIASTSGYIISGGIGGGNRPTTSSLANFYAERPTDLVGYGEHPSTTVNIISGSSASIDRGAAYTYRTFSAGSRIQPSTSTLSRVAPHSTFGYGPAQSSFHTLPHHPHHHHAPHNPSSLNYELSTPAGGRGHQQKLSPSDPRERSNDIMMDQINNQSVATQVSLEQNGAHEDDLSDDTDMSIRMAHGSHRYNNGNNGESSMIMEGDDDPNDMIIGLDQSDPNYEFDRKHNSKPKRFNPATAYITSEQSDSLLVDD